MTLVPRPHDQAIAENGNDPLRVLIANGRHDRLELLAEVVTGLGHKVIAREIDVNEVGAVTARERPDVALVGLGLSSEHALELIGEIVRKASCPVIALLTTRDPAYVHEAAKRGVFAYIVDTTPEELQSAIDITPATLHRIPQPGRSLWTPGRHRTGKRRLDGSARDRQRSSLRDATRPLPAQRSQACRHRRSDHRQPPVAGAHASATVAPPKTLG
jgi:CheY-like chemotaxis protein